MPTQAGRKAKKRADKINSRLTNRPLPTFDPGAIIAAGSMASPCIVVATDGKPYRVDAGAGTIEHMRWAR